MAESPSWKTSTLSQAFILSTICYGALILVVAAGLIFKLDVETAKLVIGWASSFWGAISAAYLTARKTGNGGNHEAPVPPSP